MSLQLRRLASLLAVLALAPLWPPVPVRADATAQTIIGYADGSMPGVGVGPIYQVPDTFGGPDPNFIRYPAPVPTATAINTMGTGAVHEVGPAKTSEPFPPTGPQPLFSNGGLCGLDYDPNHHSFSQVYVDTGSTTFREGAVYVVSMPDLADTNNWRSCTGLNGFNLFTVALQNSTYGSNAIVQVIATRGFDWDCAAGPVYYNTPRFLYTPNPLGGGCGSPYNLVPLAYNHNYYLRVDNFDAGGYNYWEYCVNDLTAKSGTKCLAAINSTGMKWGVGGAAYWAGSETADTNDTMGGYANADYLLYAFHQTTTAGAGSYPNLSCRVIRNGGLLPPSYYHCTNGTYNGWDDFFPWTY